MYRLPTTRRQMKRLRRNIQVSARLEEEPKDLRVTRGRHGMEQQRPDTNGCEGGATVLTVLNHADLSQAPRVAVKSAPDMRGTRHNTIAGKRPRRHTPAISPPAPAVSLHQSSSPPERRRITRHAPSPVLEKKVVKSAPNRRNVLSYPSHAAVSSPSLVSVSSLAEITPLSNSRQSRHHISLTPAQTTSNSVTRKREVKHRRDPAVDSELVRASKRMRLQYQPFQSPTPPSVIPAILRNTAPKVSDDKILVFSRGDFLAVRNETGGFYVCRTAQNVYKSSKRFKIQWMNNDTKPELYTPDFFDNTDFECILTNLRMRRIDKNKYILPTDEKQRTLNILQRALNVENGMDVPDLLQVTKDGVDVSIVGKEDEDEPRPKKQNAVKSIASNLRGRGRPRKPSSRSDSQSPDNFTEQKERKRKPKTAVMKVRAKARERARGKPKTAPALILSVKKGEPATVRVKKVPAEHLRQNSKVIVFEKDPTFETNLPIPFISTTAHSRLLIRAVLMSDMTLLQALLADTKNICSLTVSRSLHINYDALTYAVLRQDHHMIRALLSAKERRYASPPDILLSNEETGSSNIAMLGHHVYNVAVSRGGKEGNNAFMKDRYHYSLSYPCTNQQISIEALTMGVSLETIGVLCQGNVDTRNIFYSDIFRAVRNGHHKLAGELVKEAFENGGYGFNFLHKEVLLNDKQPLSKFKPQSVVKKATENGRITPLHCAAINPNPDHLASLLAVAPHYNLPDKNGWQPIHYASVIASA